jgi:hypothetical protein
MPTNLSAHSAGRRSGSPRRSPAPARLKPSVAREQRAGGSQCADIQNTVSKFNNRIVRASGQFSFVVDFPRPADQRSETLF